MAAAAIVGLAPLAQQVIQAAIQYEQARHAAANSAAPTAAQLAALATSIEATDAQIEKNATAQIASDSAPAA